jgi:hypothetical protein
MLPEKLYVKLLKRKGLPYNEMLKEMEYYKRRVDAFLSNIDNYEYKEIYLADCITELIKHRRFHFYCHSGIEVMDLDVQDIIDLLQNVISILKTHNNYNIAFIPQSIDDSANCTDFSCIIKERGALVIEAYVASKSLPEVRLSVEGPLPVKALDGYFNEIWNHIVPEYKDKGKIISWIQSQIDLLKDK